MEKKGAAREMSEGKGISGVILIVGLIGAITISTALKPFSAASLKNFTPSFSLPYKLELTANSGIPRSLEIWVSISGERGMSNSKAQMSTLRSEIRAQGQGYALRVWHSDFEIDLAFGF